MRLLRLFCIGGCFLFIAIAALSVSPSRADAHGIGGLEPSETTARVVSITPKTSDFSMRSIENGVRIRITRTSPREVIVLGVDSEPYIRLAQSGVYLNKKSATRIINQSTSTTFSIDDLKKQYERTSSDPHAKPVWEKTSSSNTYAWHDHRAHYMGVVPTGITRLGTNQMVVRVGSTDYKVTISFRSASTPHRAIPFIALAIFFVLVALGAMCFRGVFLAVMNRAVCCVALGTIAVFEIFHIAGYMSFAQQSIVSEITSSLYGIVLVILAIVGLYKFSRNESLPWSDQVRLHAPLICATGFIGVAAGSLIEYRTLLEPFLATSLSPGVTRILVVYVGCASSAIFALGLLHIKQPVLTKSV